MSKHGNGEQADASDQPISSALGTDQREEKISPALGKISPAFFERVIASRLGGSSKKVLVGPKNGVDTAILDMGANQVLAMTTDPFFVVPSYGWQRAGWFAVHILASDLATSGLRPQFLSIDLNLPPSMSEEELQALWIAVDKTCKELDIAVVAGHTGRYEGCSYPMIGGATLLGIGRTDEYVTPALIRPDDIVLLTKGAAVEAAALMAVSFPQKIAREFGEDFAKNSESLFFEMSTVKEALIAAGVGVRQRGVTAMHDATECGIYGGIVELAAAGGVGIEIDHQSIPIRDEVAKICSLFEMDPYTSISEGSLLITCRPHAAPKVLEALQRNGISAAKIGRCREKSGVVIRFPSGAVKDLAHPEIDPFWAAFGRAQKEV